MNITVIVPTRHEAHVARIDDRLAQDWDAAHHDHRDPLMALVRDARAMFGLEEEA
jgi:hypothetical protein